MLYFEFNCLYTILRTHRTPVLQLKVCVLIMYKHLNTFFYLFIYFYTFRLLIIHTLNISFLQFIYCGRMLLTTIDLYP